MPPKGADEVSRVSNQACWLGNPRRGCGTAPTPIFQKPRAQWPGRNRRKPLRFCAPEMFCPPQGVTPVNGVRGKATMSTKCSSGAVPGGVLVTLPPWAKSLAARRRRNPPARNETALSSSPHPSRLRRATFPYPLCRFATSPLDKGSRPPRGRLLGGFGPLTKKGSRKAGQRRGGEIPRTLHLLWLKPPQSGFNKEGSTHETNQMRKRRNLQT